MNVFLLVEIEEARIKMMKLISHFLLHYYKQCNLGKFIIFSVYYI